MIEVGPRILGVCHEDLSKYATKELTERGIRILTNCKLKEVTDTGFIMEDGTVIKKEIRIWTAGIKSPEWLKNVNLQLNHQNRIKVNPYLQSLDDPNIYAFGDCACAPVPNDPSGSRGLPASAQVAHQQAKWLTTYLQKVVLEKGTYRPFHFENAGMIISLGEKTAVGTITVKGPKKEFNIQGRWAKVLYESLYRNHQIVIHGLLNTASLWLADKLRSMAKPLRKLH